MDLYNRNSQGKGYKNLISSINYLLKKFPNPKVNISIIITLSFIGTLLALVSPGLIGLFFYEIETPGLTGFSIKLIILLLLLSEFLAFILSYLKNRLVKKYSINFSSKLFYEFYLNNMMSSANPYISKNNFNKFLSLASSGTKIFEELFISSISTFLTAPFMFISMGIILICINYKLALLTFIPIPILIISVLLLTKKLKLWFPKIVSAEEQLIEILETSFNMLPIIHIFSVQSYFKNKYTDHNTDLINSKKAYENIIALLFPLTGFISFLGVIFVLFYQTENNPTLDKISIGTIVTFLAYLTYFYYPLSEISRANYILQNCSILVDKMKENDIKNIQDSKPYLNIINSTQNNSDIAISISNLSFDYDKQPIFSDLSAVIKINKINLITGKTGSGKTTLLRILLGLLRPKSGEIEIYTKYPTEDTINNIHQLITFSPQDPSFANQSIKDNILLGTEFNQECYNKALTNAHLNELIQNKPLLDNYIIGKNGNKLSSGEKTRLSIARALYFIKPIIILDEPFAGLDYVTLKIIADNIMRLSETHTLIISTHHLPNDQFGNVMINLD